MSCLLSGGRWSLAKSSADALQLTRESLCAVRERIQKVLSRNCGGPTTPPCWPPLQRRAFLKKRMRCVERIVAFRSLCLLRRTLVSVFVSMWAKIILRGDDSQRRNTGQPFHFFRALDRIVQGLSHHRCQETKDQPRKQADRRILEFLRPNGDWCWRRFVYLVDVRSPQSGRNRCILQPLQ